LSIKPFSSSLQAIIVGIKQRDIEASLFQTAAKYTVEHGSVNSAVFQGLHLNALIADDLELDLIALLIETEMLEPKHDAHPTVPPAGDAESFAAQFLGSLDGRLSNEIVGVRLENALTILNRVLLQSPQGGGAAGAAEVNVA
jgi:hypothetical protein